MGDVGRVRIFWCERICGISVNRYAITLEFPVTGDIDLVPVTDVVIRIEEIFWPVVGIFCPVEFPFSVKRLVVWRDISGTNQSSSSVGVWH